MNAAIVGLMRGYQNIEHYSKLIHRNRLLHRNFNKHYGYPIIIFHEGNILPEHQKVMHSITPNLIFIDISDRAFEIPAGVLTEWQTQLGYKHMCRFYAWQIYEFVSEFDYIMRLDDDSMLESPIRYDLFQLMQQNDLDYGYLYSEDDYHPATVATLPDFTRTYIRENSLSVNCSLSEINTHYFYTNFYIARVSFWFQRQVQDFLQAVDASLGIYQFRWGDHVIQTHALKMFSEPPRWHKFDDIHYSHGSHDWSNYPKNKMRMKTLELTKRYRKALERRYLNYRLKTLSD